MKEVFKPYFRIWVICFALFNVSAFLIPRTVKGNFWIAYIFINLALIGQLYCVKRALNAETLQNLFYNIPIITIGRTGALIMLIFGIAAMAIPAIPDWLAVIVCMLVLGFTAVAVISTSSVSEEVGRIDEKIKKNTMFIKQLLADSYMLVQKAETDNKEIVNQVYNALRYSDPVSCEMLNPIEAQITVKFNEFSDAVINGNNTTENLGRELLILISDRNTKCRLFK